MTALGGLVLCAFQPIARVVVAARFAGNAGKFVILPHLCVYLVVMCAF